MYWSFPRGSTGKEPASQCRRHKRCRFDPWVRKIPWSRKWQPTPLFLPGKFLWTEEPSRLQSRGSQRVGHNWVTKHIVFMDLILLNINYILFITSTNTWSNTENWYIHAFWMLSNWVLICNHIQRHFTAVS